MSNIMHIEDKTKYTVDKNGVIKVTNINIGIYFGYGADTLATWKNGADLENRRRYKALRDAFILNVLDNVS